VQKPSIPIPDHADQRALWQRVLEGFQAITASGKAVSAFRWLTLSTIGTDGVDARTVVCRDFDIEQLCFTFFSDKRAPKIRQIEANPKVHALFFDPTTLLQIRCAATANILPAGTKRTAHWESVSPRAQADYLGKRAPGEHIGMAADHELLPDVSDTYFAAISCQIARLDILQLGRDGHQRLIATHRHDNGWAFNWAAP